MRMVDNEITNKVLYELSSGKRNTGSPKMRWIDCILKDTRALGIKDRKAMARDRDIWRGLLLEAKVHPGIMMSSCTNSPVELLVCLD